MAFTFRDDGLTLLTCDGCGRYMKRSGRRSLLPAEQAAATDVDVEYQPEQDARTSATKYEWEERDGRWLCSVCLMTTSFP